MAGIFDLLSFGQDAPGGGLLGRINNPLTLAGLGILAGQDANSAWQNGMQGFALGSHQQQEMRKEAQRRQALQQYAGGADIRPLLLSGDPQLMQVGLSMDARKAQEARDARDYAFREQEAKRTQANADRSFGLQSQSAARSDPANRARLAEQYGVKPGTPEYMSYVMNGELPAVNTTIAAQVDQRKQAASAIGLAPENPAYNAFILTGKMPREDAQPLTATDKKAILEADEMVLSNQAAIDSLNRAKDLSKEAFAGPGAGKIGYAASFLGDTSDWGKSGSKTLQLENEITSNALGQLKAIFGGAPTEGERKILLDIQGSVSKPDNVRREIYERAAVAAQKRLEFNKQRADQLRGNTYYKPQGGQQQKPAGVTQATAPTTEIPQAAIAALRGNPALKADFEAKYGAGTAAAVLR